MFSYLNLAKNYQILQDIKQMSNRQLENAERLCKLYFMSSCRNEGFIFTIAPEEVRNRTEYFIRMVGEECRKRFD